MKTTQKITTVDDLSIFNPTADDVEQTFKGNSDDGGREGPGIEPLGGFAYVGEGEGGFDKLSGTQADDGFPGGATPSSTEVWGTGDDDVIDHFQVGFAQTLYGFGGDDDITAGYNDDIIFGGIGNDEVYANAGDDIVLGQDGDDFLLGQDGDDELHAGDGADTVMGNDDDDTIFLVDDGDQDVILFGQGDDQDIVDNFELGIDKIQPANFGLTEFADVAPLISYNQAGDQALIDFGGGDQMIFTNLDGPLGAGDFLF